MSNRFAGCVVLVALLGLSGMQELRAVPLLPNTSVALPGTTAAARPELAGTVLEDVSQPFSFVDDSGHTLSGVVQNRVVRSTVDGTIDFYWYIRDTSGSSPAGDPGAITALRLGGFGNFALDADWRIDGVGTVAPTIAVRFADPGNVNFHFSDPALTPPNDSRFFFLDTQATAYAEVGTYDFTGTGGNGISASYPTFAPVSSTPEPGNLALLAAGLLLVGIRRYRAK